MKNKRIKRVFTNGAEVLHLWANQAQSDARTRNVFFKDKSCYYSYGYYSELELGRLVEYKGQTVALINSNITNKHLDWAYDAVSHLIRFKSSDGLEAKNIKNAMLREQSELIDEIFGFFKQTKFRYPEHSLSCPFNSSLEYSLQFRVNEFNRKCKALGFNDHVLDFNENNFKELYAEHIQLRIERQAELSSPEAMLKREADRLKRQAYKVKRWRQGEYVIFENSFPVVLRVKNNEVQTSSGASVPIDHAMRLIKLLDKNQAKQGERIGHYRFDKKTDTHVIIGCQCIPLSEVDWLRKELSKIPASPLD